MSFVSKISAALSGFDMIRKKDAVLIGVSGGPDSMALACTFLLLKDSWELMLGIAHLNHCLRGAEADRDQEFVESFADRHGIPFHTKTEDVAQYAVRNRLSLEEAGRNCRLSFLSGTARENHYTRIALGHHKDDNAEQVLINLLRGAGSRGLSGIMPKTGTLIIRPLIQVYKSDILDFLKTQNQDFIEDTSNKDTVFLRNKIRHELLPLLAAEYNPDIRNTLNRLSDVIRQEDEWMQIQARERLDTLLVSGRPDMLALKLSPFNDLHTAMKRRIARLSVETVKGNLKRISMVHIEDILALARTAVPDKSLDLPDQVRVFILKGKICFKKETTPLRALKR